MNKPFSEAAIVFYGIFCAICEFLNVICVCWHFFQISLEIIVFYLLLKLAVRTSSRHG